MAISPRKALELGRQARVRAAEEFIDKRLTDQFTHEGATVYITTTTCKEIDCLSEGEFRELVNRYRSAGWHTSFKDLDSQPNTLIFEKRREPFTKKKLKQKEEEKP